MRRREFIAGLGSAATWPVIAGAQQPSIRRIGALMPFAGNAPEEVRRIAAFREGLQQFGWVEGRNIQIEYRWTPQVDRLEASAKELVALAPELIVVQSDAATAALRRETWSIPIVFTSVGDPIAGGFIQSLARPGGNATGFTNFEASIGGKWLEILKEVAPRTTRALAILQQETPANANFLRATEEAAPALNVVVTAAGVHNAAEIESAIDAFPAEGGGLIVMPNAVTTVNRKVIFSLVGRHRLAAVYPFRFFVQEGGLVSYGIDQAEGFRRAGEYIDRILKGEKPADLPTQAINKFELAINLKTAKALGLDVPPTLLARADEVIE
jgi:putative ABC transport system substrate-binding protein